MQNRVQRAFLPSGCSSFVKTMLPKAVLQIVIRPWYRFIIVAVEQSSSVTAGHFQEMGQRRFERPTMPLGYTYRTQHFDKRFLERRAGQLLAICQHMCGCSYPSVGSLYRRP